MSSFVDIHSHKDRDLKNISIQSRFIQDVKLTDNPSQPYATGIHPWHINQINTSEQLRVLDFAARHPMVCAIGECGIDRSIPIQVSKQIEIFEAQVMIAQKNEKPLIIHNVRAHSDFLALIKRLKPKTPWVFHGFTGNLRIAHELIKHGAYLSFGHHLLRDNSKASEVFQEIPLENIFLETDDWDGNIEQIYIRASELKELTLSDLKEEIYQNFRSVFRLDNRDNTM